MFFLKLFLIFFPLSYWFEDKILQKCTFTKLQNVNVVIFKAIGSIVSQNCHDLDTFDILVLMHFSGKVRPFPAFSNSPGFGPYLLASITLHYVLWSRSRYGKSNALAEFDVSMGTASAASERQTLNSPNAPLSPPSDSTLQLAHAFSSKIMCSWTCLSIETSLSKCWCCIQKTRGRKETRIPGWFQASLWCWFEVNMDKRKRPWHWFIASQLPTTAGKGIRDFQHSQVSVEA